MNMTSACIRISSLEVDPTFISTALGLAPTRQHLRGELRSPRNPNSSIFEQSVWVLESALPDNADLADHISSLVSVLESRKHQLNEIARRTTGIDLFCMFSSENGQGSTQFTPVLLGRVAALNVDLTIDLYPST